MLKKLFSRKSILTEGPQATTSDSREERARATRVPRSLLPSVRFEGETPLNLSATGIALDAAKFRASPGSQLRGKLELGSSDAFPVELLVIYCGSDRLGCRFEGPAEQRIRLRGAIQRHVAIEVAALSLHPVASEGLKAEVDGTPCWYTGSDSSEIHWVERDGRIVRFSLSMHDQHIEGAPGGPLRYGRITGDSPNGSDEGVRYKASHLVRWEAQVPPEALSRFRRLVETAPALAERESGRRQLLEML